jgi:Ca2+-binding RTX toxin-like protein
VGVGERKAKLVLAAIATALGSLVLSAPASAAVTCTTDDFGRPSVSITGPTDAVALKVVGGAITWDPGANGDAFLPCGGGVTVNSTDTIFVGGAAGTAQGLVIDLSGGPFAPGFSNFDGPVPESIPEIEWVVDLRGGAADIPDTLWVKGTEGEELNWLPPPSHSPADVDVDVTFPNAVPELIRLVGQGAHDVLGGRTIGYDGSDAAYLLQIEGGPGDDVLFGTFRRNTEARCRGQRTEGFGFSVFAPRDQNDRWECLIGDGGEDRLYADRGSDKLLGGRGDDRLRGEEGPDRMVGGSGVDNCDGGPGEDHERSCERGPDS